MHILVKENSVKVLQVKTNLEPQFSGDTIVQYNSEVDARNTIETAVVANIWSSIQGVQLVTIISAKKVCIKIVNSPNIVPLDSSFTNSSVRKGNVFQNIVSQKDTLCVGFDNLLDCQGTIPILLQHIFSTFSDPTHPVALLT